MFGGAYLGDDVAIGLCIGGVLIGGEARCPVVDQFVQRLLFDMTARVMLGQQAFRVRRRDTADIEGRHVVFHLGAVQANGAVERAQADRDLTLLPGKADHDHVRIDRVMQIADREGLGIEGIEVAGLALDAGGEKIALETF